MKKIKENFLIIDHENEEAIHIIKDFILDYFEMNNFFYDGEKRIIKKWDNEYPMFAPKTKNINSSLDYIYLAVNSYNYWCQVIYQLSHEISHCFIHCNEKDGDKLVSWIEETICEALSLYFLKLFYENYDKTDLYKLDKDYKDNILNYLNDILKETGNNWLKNCSTKEELMEINNTSEIKREDRKSEMVELYRLLDNENIKGLIKYRDYIISGTKFLDTYKYKEAYKNNEVINYLCELQENKL